MKLHASLIVAAVEADRYLPVCVEHLDQFCDEVTELLDGERGSDFLGHEGRARQALLELTLARNPTHVLAIDADEFVTDGQRLRALCREDAGPGAWTLNIEEVWKADDQALWIRTDGAWGLQSRSPILYRVPAKIDGRWRIMDRQLACGREPMAVRQLAARAPDSGVQVLHFGWTNESERAARYQRYVDHDGGKFHRRAHLDSIMWPDSKVRLERRDWPESLEPFKAGILERATWVASPA